jgi:hypothetical protein
MAQEQPGVNISLREIYDIVQEVKNDVKGIAPRMQQMEKDVALGVEAHDTAKEALRLASKHEDSFKWFWRALGAAFIVAIVGAVVSFMVLAIQLSVQNQVNNLEVPKQEVNVESSTPKTSTEGGNK